MNTLPTDSSARKDIPLARGCFDYFPSALAYVAMISKAGNDKHNPGEPMHHARGKSSDHADCILRHLIDRGGVDAEDQLLHSGKLAWRALALLQEELEAAGAPLARGARLPDTETSTDGKPPQEPAMKKAMPAFLKHQKAEAKMAGPKGKKMEAKETKMVKAMMKKSGRGK